jgi:hypothetical protein
MTDQLSTVQVRQYHDNIAHLLEQKGGQLRQWVRSESQNSEKQFYEQMGSIQAEQVDTRFAPSPQANTPFDRRMVTLVPYHVGDFIDKFEKVQTIVDPSSMIVQNFVRALGREADRTIYQAMFGTSYSGKEGTTANTYPTTLSSAGGPVIGVDFGTANSTLTVAKLIEASRAAAALHWDVDEQMHLIYNAAGRADLLGTTQVTSSDFNSVKALVAGQITGFMGFEFHLWEGYVLDGTNVMRGTGGGSEVVDMFPVFTKGSVVYATGLEVETEVTRRADRSFHWYAYARMMCGATRLEENRILKIERWISG